MIFKKINIAIIGLGYVGLPLAVEFAKKFNVIGYDYDKNRVKDLNQNYDKNHDVSLSKIIKANNLKFTTDINYLKDCNVYIITVPTPIFKNKKPNLNLIKQACKTISKFIKKNDVIILESTVYPGVTEEVIAPFIEKNSDLKFNKDFFLGYSPERINPNDKKNNLTNIIKITSGSNRSTAHFVDNLYKSIIKVGTKKVSSIRIAEAAKVIENTQRDINIAFMNELVLIFNKLNLNTSEVLNAASTKWNFLNFTPGLVGGHCIGVDPYYLSYKSKIHGYSPTIINAGRKINDNFPKYIANKAINEMKKVKSNSSFKFLIMGISFKENCNDFRNSKSIELFKILKKRGIKTDCFDPLVNSKELKLSMGINLIPKLKKNYYDCIIISVKHKKFKIMGEEKIKQYLNDKGKLFDVKNLFKFQTSNISF